MFFRTLGGRLHAIGLCLVVIAPTGLYLPAVAQGQIHPWRPPFGLDRIGLPLDMAADNPRPFEADALARPDQIVNPVDLGTILVPAGWLVVTDGQKGTIDIAAICGSDVPDARGTAWFESAPAAKTVVDLPMAANRRVQTSIPLPPIPATLDRNVLYVSIASANGVDLWHKRIQTMVVHAPPKWPAFGAVETKLRYDAPISVRGADGKFSSLNYAEAWDPKFQDVVVALPNGSRFVFWRGSSYIPFWAGRYNTGFCYEWAECEPPKDAHDCVEPLMDKELRYSRVQIIESTPARVHVRWNYQSCDFDYRVWGDSVVEDYYFYPDGFGTRVLTLQSDPKANYELNELILLTSQGTYPLDVLPPNLVDILFVDGQKRELTFPFHASDQTEKMKPRDMPAVYRVRLHKDDPMAAIYFSPFEKSLPETVYGHFADQGQIVTPVYWGSHWPLARGNTTGGAIDDRVQFTPAHNSIMTWGYFRRPTPLHADNVQAADALGRIKPMRVQTWAWLIAQSKADDAELLQCAASFSNPPTIEVQGARLDEEHYMPERRAIRLKVEQKSVTIAIKPTTPCVNPVFELSDAPKTLVEVRLADRQLNADEYAWDGKTLWLHATVANAVSLQLKFAGPGT